MSPLGHITTYSGLPFNLANPTQEMVRIEDIAHHLSLVCRWAGAPHHLLSVAQHSVLVSKIVPPELRRWALLHDAAEAYIGDLTRPLKVLVPAIHEIEERIMHVIADKFGLSWPEPWNLVSYDNQIAKLEAALFIRNHDGLYESYEGNICDIADLRPDQQLSLSDIEPMAAHEAEMLFLWRYRRLFEDDDGM